MMMTFLSIKDSDCKSDESCEGDGVKSGCSSDGCNLTCTRFSLFPSKATAQSAALCSEPEKGQTEINFPAQ